MDLAAQPKFADVRRIAVLRANGLGDYIFALPALDSLRAAYPEAQLVLLGRATHAELLADRRGAVDRVIVLPPIRGLTDQQQAENPPAVQAFIEALAAQRWDLAIQLHGGGRYSNPLVLALQARHTVGLRTADAAALERWLPYVYFQPEVVRYLEVAALAGAAPVTLTPRLAVRPADRDTAARLLGPTAGPLVALFPGATDPRRRWPLEHFAAVADRLIGEGADVAVLGTDSERALTRGVIERMRRPARCIDRLSLSAYVGLLERADLLVGNDSGPLHLAEAVGTATVGIYWCGNVINGAALLRGRHRLAVSWTLECPSCGSNCIHQPCDHRPSFVAEVPVAAVVDLALELLRNG